MLRGAWAKVTWVAVTLTILTVASLGWGADGFSLADIANGIAESARKLGVARTLRFASELEGEAQIDASIRYDILMHLRGPRILCAILAGSGLAIAGVAFQTIFRNPLADPYIIGSSSGAALGAALAVLCSSQIAVAGLTPLGACALLGSLAVVGLVFAIGKSLGAATSLTLLLAGIAISSLANAIVSLLLYLHSRDAVATIVTWMMGSFADCDWSTVSVLTIAVALSATWIWGSSRKLDAYALGDRTAQSLGLSTGRLQVEMLLAASLVTSFSVAAAGIIGFVGLIAPQLARMLAGNQHAVQIPLSGLLGGLLLVSSDTLARVIISPVELPIGIVTALIGAPFFLGLLLRSSPTRRAR